MRWRPPRWGCQTIELVAVTRGPGLVAALLVGFACAKATAAALELPLAPVDHLHGHIAASFVAGAELEPPFVSLIASGGHTFVARVRDRGPDYEVLGQTLDDAAGEAFDKGARLLGLGYPGGPALERLAREGDPEAFRFPTGARVRGLDFSFAGLKTALLYKVRELGEAESTRQPRRSGRLLPARDRRGAVRQGRAGTGRRRGSTGWRSGAGSRPTGRCASG